MTQTNPRQPGSQDDQQHQHVVDSFLKKWEEASKSQIASRSSSPFTQNLGRNHQNMLLYSNKTPT